MIISDIFAGFNWVAHCTEASISSIVKLFNIKPNLSISSKAAYFEDIGIIPHFIDAIIAPGAPSLAEGKIQKVTLSARCIKVSVFKSTKPWKKILSHWTRFLL